MSAYVVVDVNVTDPVAYDVYREKAAASVAAHGGRYVTRGGTTTVLEGEWSPVRLVILEFPDAETARRWYTSDEYGEARSARAGACTMKMVAVEGVA